MRKLRKRVVRDANERGGNIWGSKLTEDKKGIKKNALEKGKEQDERIIG